MIEEEAYVIDVVDGRVWLEKKNSSACSSCSQACPSLLADGLFEKKRFRLQVSSNLALHPGDKVLIGVSEDVLALGSFLIYMLPLFGLIGGALLGKFIDGSDLASALGGMLGLVLCYAGLKSIRVFDREDYQPVILRKIN